MQLVGDESLKVVLEDSELLTIRNPQIVIVRAYLYVPMDALFCPYLSLSQFQHCLWEPD
jgi:hypothetical protein